MSLVISLKSCNNKMMYEMYDNERALLWCKMWIRNMYIYIYVIVERYHGSSTAQLQRVINENFKE